VIWLEADGQVLVKKGKLGKVMADLYEFPYFEMGTEIWLLKKIDREIENTFGMKVKIVEKLPRVVHTFTRYKAELYPFRFLASKREEIEGCQWVDRSRLAELPFSSGHRRILTL
jgi:A/G-specific adenine glycosylase